ncbi:hypothetical protein VDGL01_01868 [Verticillium dahliae]
MFGRDDNHNYTDGAEPKKSLYQRFKDRKKGGEISEADVAKYTGMSKAQLAEWAKDRPGVGGQQAAGKINAGEASGFAGMNAADGYATGIRGEDGPKGFPRKHKDGVADGLVLHKSRTRAAKTKSMADRAAEPRAGEG